MLTHFTADRADCDTIRRDRRPSHHSIMPYEARGFVDAFPSCLPANQQLGGCDVLLRKLQRLGALNLKEQQYLRAAVGTARWRSAGSNLFEQGRPTMHVSVLVSGLACRYKMLAEGRRQILGFLLPGDLCDHHFVASNMPDHSVSLLTKSLVVQIPLEKLSDILAHCPNVGRALQLAAVVDNAIAREWLVSVGQRSAIEKVAHLFCELHERYLAIDAIAADGSFGLLVNQSALADSTGLSLVHINRTLKQLRAMGLVVLQQRRLLLTDMERLRGLADFDGQYLHVRNC